MPPPLIFDRSLLRARRQRGLRLGPATFLLDQVADELANRLGLVLRRFGLAVDLGTPTAAVRTALLRDGAIGAMIALDPMIGSGQRLSGDHAAAAALRVVGDEEALPFADNTLDLVVSGLSLQAVNDLPGVLVQVRRALKPDGLFLAALLGGDTLAELRESFATAESELDGGVSPRVAPFADLRDLGSLLQRAGFALPVTDVDRIVVRYDNAFALMQEIGRAH